MNADQIAWARAVAEESYDGRLIRDLCNALAGAWDEGCEAGYLALFDVAGRPRPNPYRDAA